MDVKLSEAVKAVGGRLTGTGANPEIRIKGVSTDSRECAGDKLFVAIPGEKFDGHDFIQQAFENGAVCAISQKDCDDFGKALIKVASTKTALCDFAEYYRSLFDIPVVAVTGSSGKTTTKDLTHFVMSTKYKTLSTEGNFNNEIGLPLTVFKLNREYECAVFEMGMNHFGELHNLSKIGRPNVCVITNVGYSHIENLGSREGILKAKSEIFDYMRDGGLAVLNGDDDMLIKLKNSKSNALYFGLNASNDVYADKIKDIGMEGISAVLHYGSTAFEVNIKIPGRHMIYNALCAAAVGFGLGLDADNIKRGIESYTGGKMRMNIIKTATGLTVINDTYNANPASMKAAIDVLSQANTPKACIIGDMLELGDYSGELHREIGNYIAEKGIEKVICVGKLAINTYNAVAEADRRDVKTYYFAEQADLLECVETLTASGETVLVKASRAMALEKTVERLINH